MLRRLLPFLALFVLSLLLAPAAGLAADVVTHSAPPPLPRTQLLPSAQLWSALAGAIVPLATYVVNRTIRSEPVSAAVLVVASAVAGALVQLIDSGSLAFDTNTLQVILTAVVGALAAHHTLWKPSGVSARLRARVDDGVPGRVG